MIGESEGVHYFYVIIAEFGRVAGRDFLICLRLEPHFHDFSCSLRDIVRGSLDELQKKSRDSTDRSPVSQSCGWSQNGK